MALLISALASGSNGNCYYVGSEEEAVLVDAGISCREVEKRMLQCGLRMDKVKAIFVSHEHSDHICGVAVLSRKYGLPVYITPETLLFSRLALDKSLVRTFSADQPVQVGSLCITAFCKAHDAADPFSFMVSSKGVQVGVFTDIGIPCPQLVHYFRQCHAAFLESNYDEVMLEKGNYPYHLKNRIRGGKGHLSNRQALNLFLEHRPSHMTHLLLSHLSKNNNRPELVEQMFAPHAGNTFIVVASRYAATEVFRVQGEAVQPPRFQHQHYRPPQLELSFA